MSFWSTYKFIHIVLSTVFIKIFPYVSNYFYFHYILQNVLRFLIILQITTFVNNIKNIYTCKLSFLLTIIVIITSASMFVDVMLNGFDADVPIQFCRK